MENTIDRGFERSARAFVQPEKDAAIDPGTIRDGRGDRVAPYKIPSLVEVIHDLPRCGAGKILRRLLVDRPLPESPSEK